MSAFKNEKKKGITYEELSWFMEPFAQYGESNLARIERICSTEANRAWISPCSSRQAFFDRISRDANNDGSGFNINYFNFFWEAILVIWFTAFNTTNSHKL